MNTENIPGMFVLTNHMRGLVTAENETVSQSRNRVGSRCFERPLYLKGFEIAIPLSLRATCTTQAKYV